MEPVWNLCRACVEPVGSCAEECGTMWNNVEQCSACEHRRERGPGPRLVVLQQADQRRDGARTADRHLRVSSIAASSIPFSRRLVVGVDLLSHVQGALAPIDIAA